MISDATLSIEPVRRRGHWARLEPLRPEHAADLFAAGQTPEVWAYLWRGPFTSLDDAREWIESALRDAADGGQIPFAIIQCASNRAVGSTRYMDIVRPDRRLEIGWTWLAQTCWRTPMNTECKYLLLGHAFEAAGCLRVQLKTDLRNTRSQQAIERLGAVREGVLRKHMVLALKGNYQRHSVMYSILDTEWPEVKQRLEAKLQTYRGAEA